MRIAILLFISCSLLAAADSFDAFGLKWTAPVTGDWQAGNEDGQQILKMLVARPQEKNPRKPTQFALVDAGPFEKVTVEAEVKRIGKSIIIVYAYKDDLHFDYAHLSSESAKQQIVHNGIFHVYGGDRVRISRDDGPASIPSDQEWYKLRLDYDASTGTVDVTVNGKHNSSLRGIDLSLGAGKVGLGSFFETAVFRNVHITGK